MKSIILLIAILDMSYASLCQSNKWLVEASPNFDVYKPFTLEAQNMNKTIKSFSGEIYIEHVAYVRQKLSWSTGIAFKAIQHKVKSAYYASDGTFDLVSRSYSLGWSNELNFNIPINNNVTSFIGVRSNCYLMEAYDSRYIEPSHKATTQVSPIIENVPWQKFLALHAADVSLNYRLLFYLNEKSALGFTTILGTNLYSDWDQFRRYAWIGLGVDVGFGKKISAGQTKQQP